MSRSGRKRTCARVETNLPDHKRLKRIAFGARRGHALGVWIAALCHSRLHELDGFCPTEALHAFAGEAVIQDLVDVGLFARGQEDELPGIMIVNYAEFNDTKKDIDRRLKRDRLRKSRKAIPRGIRLDSQTPSSVKPVERSREEKSSVEKDQISDSDARAIPTGLERDPASLAPSSPALPPPVPADSSTPARASGPPAPADSSTPARAAGHGTFGMHVDAYGEGIRAVTGVPYVKSGPFEAKMLEDCAARAGGKTGQDLLAWYREKAERFARSVNPKFGYGANRFVAWLNGGEPTDQSPSPAPAATRDLSRPESRNLNNLGAGLPPLPSLRGLPS